jgi:hypothetical protein
MSLLTSPRSTRKFCPSERLRASRGVRRLLADTDHHRHSHESNRSYVRFDRFDFCNNSESRCPLQIQGRMSRSQWITGRN